MKLNDFLKNKAPVFIVCIIAVLATVILFLAGQINLLSLIVLICIDIIAGIIPLLLSYKHKKKFYDVLLQKINSSEKPYNSINDVTYPDFFEGTAAIDIAKYCSQSALDEFVINNSVPFNLRDFVMLILQEKYNILINNKISTAIKNLETDISEDQVLLYFYINTFIEYVILNKAEKTYIKFFYDETQKTFICEANVNIRQNDYYILFMQKLAKAMHRKIQIESDQALKISLHI